MLQWGCFKFISSLQSRAYTDLDRKVSPEKGCKSAIMVQGLKSLVVPCHSTGAWVLSCTWEHNISLHVMAEDTLLPSVNTPAPS